MKQKLKVLLINRKEQIFLRTFANIIRRCDEAERRIKYISQNLSLSLLDIFYRNILDILKRNAEDLVLK